MIEDEEDGPPPMVLSDSDGEEEEEEHGFCTGGCCQGELHLSEYPISDQGFDREKGIGKDSTRGISSAK